MLVAHSWLKEYLGDATPSTEEIERLLTFHAFEIEEVETNEYDTVIDVDVLPNRSSDCLCHRGIARELATIIDTPLVHDPLSKKPTLTETDAISVSIEDHDVCPRFTASLISGVAVAESPKWLKDRLRAIGQRPINNIVDATNYVMYAIGQPLHAYDADLFPQEAGTWQFDVRYAKEGETIDLIAEGGKDEDRTVELNGSELLIVDRTTNTPAGLAGVKGGRYAGVHKETKNIIIEAAHFDPILTRKTARRLGIVIDASKRFENEPSRELPPYAQAEIVELITKIAGGQYEGMVDVYETEKQNPTVTVTPAHVNALLGLALDDHTMADILRRVGCEVDEQKDVFAVTGPWERSDLNIEEDFIEEIGRVYGYEHVASVRPDAVPLPEVNAQHYYHEQIRSVLVSNGFSEVITSSFRKKDKIKLKNALASDKAYVRSSLRKNLTEALDTNTPLTDLLGIDAVRIFEIGTVFEKGDGVVSERTVLGIAIRQKQSGYTPKDDIALQEIVNALATKLGIELSPTIEKGVAEIDLDAMLAKLPVPKAYEPVAESVDVTYRPFSVYPYITRDIALWVPEEIDVTTVETFINERAGDLRVRTTLFDEYHKNGQVSYAFRLVFQSGERTLTDAEVNTITDQIYTAISENGWEVR